jgi:aspartyl-tRNA(Asn)/glutamyl-tRNA(Gln) amidotransferase subunit C
MIAKEDIKHVADLAKLRLNDEEISQYSTELSKIINYVDQLKEVDTHNVEPTAQVTGMVNQTRADKVDDWDEAERKNSLQNNFDQITNQVKVPRVLND